ncbi:MAG: DUF4838 domain-containing protein, partial [Abditibacteriota bacterium]|nr:DUF4838 domain-containing protein [Abditibacteriota bacterium]
VGQTEWTKKQVPDFDWDSLKRDGILIKSGPDSLVLAGDRPAGTLYAVYDFLEEALGVRFLTPEDEYVPRLTDIATEMRKTYRPPFYLREDFFREFMHDERFRVKRKLNGRTNPATGPISPEWGGCWELLGGGHTFAQFLPPSEYYGDHPEWFTEFEGKRVSAYAQLCLSNDECVEALTEQVLRTLRDNPGARMISVSQNDNELYCRCKNCAALAKKYGSQSGVILQAVNRVARAVAKEFPGVLVETFAYDYSVTPPRGIRPEKNVIVRLCNIRNDFGTPLPDSASSIHPKRVAVNLSYLKSLDGWRRLTDNLFIWNYTVNFSASYLMHPNFFCLKPDLLTFRKNGAKAVFEQGDAFNKNCAFTLLKAYMAARLMWDPELDDDLIMKEFLSGYYGAAGPYLYEIIRRCEALERQSPLPLGCYLGSAHWLDKASFGECMALFRLAMNAVKGNEALEDRVLGEAMYFEYSLTRLSGEARQEWSRTPWLLYRDTGEFEAALYDYVQRTDNRYNREGGLYEGKDAVREEGRAEVKVLPEALRSLAPEEYFCMPGSDFVCYIRGVASDVKEDPLAEEGFAGVQYTDTAEWGLQRKVAPILNKALSAGFSKMHIFVSARAEGPKDDAQKACELHLYDFQRGGVFSRGIMASELSGDKYTVIDCGETPLWECNDVHLCILPFNNGAVKGGVWVDKVYMIFEK